MSVQAIIDEMIKNGPIWVSKGKTDAPFKQTGFAVFSNDQYVCIGIYNMEKDTTKRKYIMIQHYVTPVLISDTNQLFQRLLDKQIDIVNEAFTFRFVTPFDVDPDSKRLMLTPDQKQHMEHLVEKLRYVNIYDYVGFVISQDDHTYEVLNKPRKEEELDLEAMKKQRQSLLGGLKGKSSSGLKKVDLVASKVPKGLTVMQQKVRAMMAYLPEELQKRIKQLKKGFDGSKDENEKKRLYELAVPGAVFEDDLNTYTLAITRIAKEEKEARFTTDPEIRLQNLVTSIKGVKDDIETRNPEDTPEKPSTFPKLIQLLQDELKANENLKNSIGNKELQNELKGSSSEMILGYINEASNAIQQKILEQENAMKTNKEIWEYQKTYLIKLEEERQTLLPEIDKIMKQRKAKIALIFKEEAQIKKQYAELIKIIGG